MTTEDFKEEVETVEGSGSTKSFFKRDKNRFEFALFINDAPICKRSFPINGYIEKSMQTKDFKNEVDKIVEMIDEDLKAKTRVYNWYHHVPEYPSWDPEMMTDPLIEEGTSIFKFVIYDNGNEVISRTWDGRYYPTYIRKNVDLTNRQVKITKNERVNIYDKEKFFADHDQLFGDLYVLKHMISDREDLVPIIQKCIYEVCSSFDGYYEKISDYHTVEEYNTVDIKRDENGNGIYTQKTVEDADGNKVPVFDAFGKPWMVPVLEKKSKGKGKKYVYNIDAYNKKVDSVWGAAVAEKTRKYLNELYISPKEKYFKKKNED